jgi:hypothetical protein
VRDSPPQNTDLDYCSNTDLYCASKEEALLRHREIAKLAKPRKSSIRFIAEWMRRDTMGNVRLVGGDRNTWSEPACKDLVCLEDAPNIWATQSLVLLYHDYIGRYLHVGCVAENY